MSYRETKRYLAELGDAMASEDDRLGEGSNDEPQGHPYSKSEFFRRPLPTEAIAALVDDFVEGRRAGQSRELDFTPWGGAYNRVPAEATAFAHRRELFLLKHAVTVEPDAQAVEKGAALRWLGRSWAKGRPWGTGRAYPNFPDPDLEDWPRVPRVQPGATGARQREIRSGQPLLLPPVGPESRCIDCMKNREELGWAELAINGGATAQ